MHRTLAVVAVAVLVSTGVTLSSPADAAARHFSTCAGLNRVYPHGVGLSGARDHTSGTPVTSFKRSGPLYRANNGPRNRSTGEYDLDRDNDHVACEKR
jgi:Excalibur calcium-binding domain